MMSIQAFSFSVVLTCVVLPYALIAHTILLASTKAYYEDDGDNTAPVATPVSSSMGGGGGGGGGPPLSNNNINEQQQQQQQQQFHRELKEKEEESKYPDNNFEEKLGNLSADGQYRPHILFVVVDDLGSNDLGMHGTGIETPVADSLAEDGLFLDNYYVLPMCSPTRIAFMSGRYPYSMGIYKAMNTGDQHGLALDEETIAQVLKRGGYSTHAIGKWHVGDSKWRHLPTFRGFQSFFGYHNTGVDDHFNHVQKGVYKLRYDKKEFCGDGCSEIVDERGNYSSHIFARESVRVVSNHNTDENGPLFLYLAFYAVHRPIQVPKKYKDTYKDKEWSEAKKTYAGMLTAADEALGEVIQSLKDSGIWEDTLVVFTSDNGALTSRAGYYGSNSPLRGGKKNVWQGGVISDGIIGGPAREKLGILKGKMTHLFHAVDWLPTLAQVAESKPNGKPLHGVAQLRTLKGEGPTRTELLLGFDVSRSWNRRSRENLPPIAAFRRNHWKLIYNFDKKTSLLFNLNQDQSENNNLASENPDVVLQLLAGMKTIINRQFKLPISNDKKCGMVKFVSTPWGAKATHPWCS